MIIYGSKLHQRRRQALHCTGSTSQRLLRAGTRPFSPMRDGMLTGRSNSRNTFQSINPHSPDPPISRQARSDLSPRRTRKKTSWPLSKTSARVRSETGAGPSISLQPNWLCAPVLPSVCALFGPQIPIAFMVEMFCGIV